MYLLILLAEMRQNVMSRIVRYALSYHVSNSQSSQTSRWKTSQPALFVFHSRAGLHGSQHNQSAEMCDAHLEQGTRPSKKLTNVRDVKRYLSSTTLARDGVIVVRHDMPFAPSRELIVVPRQVLDGLLTALHLKLSHPTKHQLKLIVRRNFYALDLDSAIERVTDTCHTCMSLLKLPQTLIDQSTSHLPDAIGVTFAADVIKRNRQLIFVIRETVSSTCVVESERHDALRDCIVHLCVEFRPLDGPPAVIRVDPAPGFIALVDDPTL